MADLGMSDEAVEDFAMRMAWGAMPADGKDALRNMARSALMVQRQLNPLMDALRREYGDNNEEKN